MLSIITREPPKKDIIFFNVLVTRCTHSIQKGGGVIYAITALKVRQTDKLQKYTQIVLLENCEYFVIPARLIRTNNERVWNG